MKLTSGLRSSMTDRWATPETLYRRLDAEFEFTDDPCPLDGLWDGLGGSLRLWCDPFWGFFVYTSRWTTAWYWRCY